MQLNVKDGVRYRFLRNGGLWESNPVKDGVRVRVTVMVTVRVKWMY